MTCGGYVTCVVDHVTCVVDHVTCVVDHVTSPWIMIMRPQACESKAMSGLTVEHDVGTIKERRDVTLVIKDSHLHQAIMVSYRVRSPRLDHSTHVCCSQSKSLQSVTCRVTQTF